MTAEAFVIEKDEKSEAGGKSSPEVLEIVRAARAGDAAAFEEIMLLTERRMAQIAWRILGDAEEVKDALQETFLRVFRHLRRFDESYDLHAWMARITVNVCRDTLRRRRGRSIFQTLDAAIHAVSADRSAIDKLVDGDERRMLSVAIDRLAPKERLAVILKDIEGMRTSEVAAILGTTVTTVRVQVSRARAKLRRMLGVREE
jgi:RNA polymerase sigma-70 factor (ECF subfamily)